MFVDAKVRDKLKSGKKKIIKNNKAYQENGVTRSLWSRGSGG